MKSASKRTARKIAHPAMQENSLPVMVLTPGISVASVKTILHCSLDKCSICGKSQPLEVIFRWKSRRTIYDAVLCQLCVDASEFFTIDEVTETIDRLELQLDCDAVELATEKAEVTL